MPRRFPRLAQAPDALDRCITDADFASGYAGAGIWSTFAIDPASGYGYAGTSNPQMEHPRSVSILKVDLDRTRPTFGEIVASYKGVHDTVVPNGQEQPVCDTEPDVYYTSRFGVDPAGRLTGS